MYMYMFEIASFTENVEWTLCDIKNGVHSNYSCAKFWTITNILENGSNKSEYTLCYMKNINIGCALAFSHYDPVMTHQLPKDETCEVHTYVIYQQKVKEY